MKIAVFGGTFDPPHKGHINLANSVINGYHADKVLFVPSANPPHKLENKVTTFEHRFTMLKSLISDNENFMITDIEQRRLPEPSFTIKTMHELSLQYQNDQLYWLIGSDSLINLHTWYKSQEFVNNFNIMTYPRPNKDVTFDMLRANWSVEHSKKLYESILELDCYDISSTDIRNTISENKTLCDKLDQKVIDYIKEFKLYE